MIGSSSAGPFFEVIFILFVAVANGLMNSSTMDYLLKKVGRVKGVYAADLISCLPGWTQRNISEHHVGRRAVTRSWLGE